MTTKQLERHISEQENLLTAHRIVKVDMQSEHATCIARVDMPEYGIRAGETFHLVAASSHPGYAYIIRKGAEGRECSCTGFAFRHSCKHAKAVNCIEVAHYYARKEAGTLVLEPVWREDDAVAHVEDSIRSGEFEYASCYGCGARVRHEGYCHKCA